MSAADAQAEPTMEEILASIRRIISEDDSAAPAADAAPMAEPDFGDEVLELNEPVMEMPETVSPDFDFDALPVEDEPEVALEEIIVEDRWEEPEPVAPPPPAPADPPLPAAAPRAFLRDRNRSAVPGAAADPRGSRRGFPATDG